MPGDYQRRLEFSNWALNSFDNNPNFGARIIFTDESTFIRHGQVSKHWTFHWSRENPHEVIEAHTQNVEKLNVWCAIWDDIIIGPFFIEGNLTGERCRNLLENEVWPQLEPLLDANDDIQPIFMLDGAPAHTSRTVTGWLIERFGGNWLGNNGPYQWPARSPDLTPLDFFLWGYLKNIVYPADTLQELRQKIIANIQEINRDTIRSLQQLWRTKLELCVGQGGGHFEQFRFRITIYCVFNNV